jgi:Fic family protein
MKLTTLQKAKAKNYGENVMAIKYNDLVALFSNNSRLSRGNISRQRASFAFGNGNIEGKTFSRATVTMVALPDDPSDETNRSETVKQSKSRREMELSAVLRQFDLMIELITQYAADGSEIFQLTPEIVVKIQSVLAFPGGPRSGYRTHDVRIATNDFVPMKSEKIPGAIESMCDHINERWESSNAIELAAYTLWKLNWIHPFDDGNGRTARALSYIILSVKLGILIPGAPTIPEQIMERRGDYFDALAKVDQKFHTDNQVDVSPISELLTAMLLRQLEAEPAVSDAEIEQISGLVESRVNNTNSTLLNEVYGSHPVDHRLWSIDDHLILQLGSKDAILEAEARLISDGEPFPNLLAIREKEAGRFIGSKERGLIIRSPVFESVGLPEIHLEHNSAIIIQGPSSFNGKRQDEGRTWLLVGALYVIRFGRDISLGTAVETLDFLLIKHMTAMIK